MAIAVVAWAVQPQSIVTGWLLVTAGFVNVARLSRWYGWLTWREPLVLILHWGYGWLALAMLLLGGAILGIGLTKEDAVHALTTGAIGVMTLAVMTRASLGHTGRPRHAGPATVCIYLLVTVAALVRVFGPSTGLSTNFVLADRCAELERRLSVIRCGVWTLCPASEYRRSKGASSRRFRLSLSC